MAAIYPFRALRPPRDKVAEVAAVPYDVVNTEEARALAEGNPLSFLHVSRPEIDLPEGAGIYSDEAYAKARENFEKLVRVCPLETETEPCLYLYRLRMGEHTQTGVAACFSVDEYDTGRIRKHERTRPDKENDRTRHLLELQAQTGPVFLTYRADRRIDALVEAETKDEPLFDFTAEDGVRHTLWRARGTEQLARCFNEVPLLYIADGHHRAASASRARAALREQNPNHTGREEYNRFLAVVFPDEQMQILPYQRVVKDLNGRTPEEFLAAVKERFDVTEGANPRGPGRPGHWHMYLAGKWYGLTLRGDAAAAASSDDPTSSLDVSLLQDNLLAPVLGVTDSRTDKRIDFVGGIRGTQELERLVNEGRAAVAFALYPTSIADLLRVSDSGGVMPPKSTWFEPKLRDGILIHTIWVGGLKSGVWSQGKFGFDSRLATPDSRLMRFVMRVLIADKFEQSGRDRLDAAGCEFSYQPDVKDETLVEAIRSYQPDALVVRSTKVTEQMLDAGALKLIVRAGAGYNTIDVAAASRRGVYVSNCPGKNSVAVAELAFALILALDRRIADNVIQLREGRWNKKEFSRARGLLGRTLGLVGTGQIGREVATRARAFGMRVVAWSRSLTDELAAELGVERRESLTDVAREADIVSVHVALKPETRGLIGSDFFGAMREGAYFINTSRGEVVDQDALRRAMHDKGIRSGLDVYASEPAGGAGEFTDDIAREPNLYGTHHIGASTDQAQEAIAAETVRIIRTFKETGRVPNVVNLARRTPATHTLVVRHRDRPGVLASVLDAIRGASINVQEMENIVFEGAEAAVARINLDAAPPSEVLEQLKASNADIIELSLLEIRA